MLETLTQAINQVVTNLPITLGLIITLFVIQIINALINYRLNILGVWPRKQFGWIGIFFSPFLHGNFSHLFFNMLPLFIFSNIIMLQGLLLFLTLSFWIILMSGILTWLLGRKGVHVGASSLIMGYLGYLLIGIYYHPDALSIVIGVTCFYYFGGMITNLFPSSNRQVSWEGHVFGFISGILATVIIAKIGLL